MGEAKAKARKDRPRDTPAGRVLAGEEAEVGTVVAGMTGAIPAMAAVATEEERAVARAKEKEKAKDTPVGEHSRGSPKKKEFAQRDVYEGVPHVQFSNTQPLIVHKLIEYRH